MWYGIFVGFDWSIFPTHMVQLIMHNVLTISSYDKKLYLMLFQKSNSLPFPCVLIFIIWWNCWYIAGPYGWEIFTNQNPRKFCTTSDMMWYGNGPHSSCIWLNTADFLFFSSKLEPNICFCKLKNVLCMSCDKNKTPFVSDVSSFTRQLGLKASCRIAADLSSTHGV